MRQAKNRPSLLMLWALVVGLTAAGCGTSNSVRSVTTAIESQFPGLRCEPETHIRLGRFSLGLVRALVRLSDETDTEEAQLLSALRSVEVSIYEVHGDQGDSASLPVLGSRLAGRGWSPVITSRESDELVQIFSQENRKGEIAGLFVVALSDDELAIVRIKGHLDRVLAEAIANDPDGLLDVIGNET